MENGSENIPSYATSTAAAVSSPCILLVDDDRIIRTVSAAILKELGYTVLTAEDGQEAVDIYQERHQSIDMVLLDMMMPIMNGDICFYRLKEIEPEVRVLMVSGYTGPAPIDQLKKDGMIGYLRKPYVMKDLCNFLAQYAAPRTE